MVRADWGAASVEAPTASGFDPFALASSSEMMSPRNEKPLDLSSPEPVLRERLSELHRRESNLFAFGVSCALKEMPDGNCTACPVSQASRTEGSIEEMREACLCRIGTEQDRVAMLMLAQSQGGC